MADKRKAALFYAKRLGWMIIPLNNIEDGRCSCGNSHCQSPGKHPLTQHGLKEATANVLAIARWWEKWPNANIGLACRANGIFALDVDARHGGIDSLYQLIAEYGELPYTVVCDSGGGGAHFYFKYPVNIVITDKQGFKSGLDIRSNGYVLLPPSDHISGKSYMWRKGCDPLSTPITEAPQWLLNMIGNDRPIADIRGDGEWSKLFCDISEGKRNDTLHRYACHLLGHGLGGVETVAIIQAVNKTYGKPPLSEKEVAVIVASAIKWRMKNEG